jgi:tetratricopeptide (TPR) repeat protein
MGRPVKLSLPALVIALIVTGGVRAETPRPEPEAQIGFVQAEDMPPYDAPIEEWDEQEPRSDAKTGIEDGPPPHSAHETKRNRLAPGAAAEAPQQPQPIERSKLLAELYQRLAAAPDPGAARPIMDAIEQVWRNSESDTANLLISRAERFVQEKDAELAMQILDAAVEVAPDVAEAWYLRARLHFVQREYVQALPNLRRALNIDPKHYRALNDLGIVLEELGGKKEALEAYRKAVKVNPFLEQTKRSVEILSREIEGQAL